MFLLVISIAVILPYARLSSRVERLQRRYRQAESAAIARSLGRINAALAAICLAPLVPLAFTIADSMNARHVGPVVLFVGAAAMWAITSAIRFSTANRWYHLAATLDKAECSA